MGDQSKEIYNNIGILYSKMNEFEKSLYFLEKALKKEPDNKMINCNILEVKKKLQNSNDVDIYIEKCNMD